MSEYTFPEGREKRQRCNFCELFVVDPCDCTADATACVLPRQSNRGNPTDWQVEKAVEAVTKSKGDPVTLPSHYTRFKIEPIFFIMENELSFWQGNVIKYVCRWDGKDGLQDLKKTRRYLDMKIKMLEGDPNWSK